MHLPPTKELGFVLELILPRIIAAKLTSKHALLTVHATVATFCELYCYRRVFADVRWRGGKYQIYGSHAGFLIVSNSAQLGLHAEHSICHWISLLERRMLIYKPSQTIGKMLNV